MPGTWPCPFSIHSHKSSSQGKRQRLTEQPPRPRRGARTLTSTHSQSSLESSTERGRHTSDVAASSTSHVGAEPARFPHRWRCRIASCSTSDTFHRVCAGGKDSAETHFLHRQLQHTTRNVSRVQPTSFETIHCLAFQQTDLAPCLCLNSFPTTLVLTNSSDVLCLFTAVTQRVSVILPLQVPSLTFSDVLCTACLLVSSSLLFST